MKEHAGDAEGLPSGPAVQRVRVRVRGWVTVGFFCSPHSAVPKGLPVSARPGKRPVASFG